MFIIEDNQVFVPSGQYESQGRTVFVHEDTRFPIPPAPVVWIENERIQLSAEKPQGFAIGTRLAGPTAWDINALGALIPHTLTVRKSPAGEVLELGQDYLLAPEHALLGIGPESCVTPAECVYATYAYSLMRLDSVYADTAGNIGYTPGIPHITTPHPPHIPETSVRLANVFLPYQTANLASEHVYSLLAAGDDTPTATMAGAVPRTLQKLRSGDRVVIVCWGDSVTAGGNASDSRYRDVDVFTSGLRHMFPQTEIEVHNVSVGGSCSANWLYPELYPFAMPERQRELDFERIIALRPDLVTQEFVNDTGLGPEMWKKAYQDIRQRLAQIGAEWMLITPHFTHPGWMGIDMRGTENRAYVQFIKDFAAAHGIALADASARWAHLWQEGLPYLTLLHNSVNHPDNRGHRLFAEEMWKCFK